MKIPARLPRRCILFFILTAAWVPTGCTARRAPKVSRPDLPMELLPGTYTAGLTGMLCTACPQAVLEAVRKVPGLSMVQVDFEARRILLKVSDEHPIAVSDIESALGKASRRINLGTEFQLENLRYRP